MPPAQLLSVPATILPEGSSLVCRRLCPAAGPLTSIGVVLPVMRRLYFDPITGRHCPFGFCTISTIEPPWAANSTRLSSLVTPLSSSNSGSIRFVDVYSWFTQRSPRPSDRGIKPTKSLLYPNCLRCASAVCA